VVTSGHTDKQYNLATIWLQSGQQSGYNLANNPAYNHNQTRPYVKQPDGCEFEHEAFLFILIFMDLAQK
jgi:hypothetical protein